MIPYRLPVDQTARQDGYALAWRQAQLQHVYVPVASPAYVVAGDQAVLAAAEAYTDAQIATVVGSEAEAAQDAVAAALTNSASVSWAYDDALNHITATVLPAGVDHNALANLTVGDPHTQYLLKTDAVESAQDAIGALVNDSPSISWLYQDSLNSLQAAVIPGGVNHDQLAHLTDGDGHPQYLRRDILTTRGDLYARGVALVQRLGVGGAGTFLRSDGTDPSWQALTDADIPDTITLTNLTQVTTRSHASLQNLAADDHAQYALLAGRAGGQTFTGGTAAGENLQLFSTSHATKGKILLGTGAAWDAVNGRLGVGTQSPSVTFSVVDGAYAFNASLANGLRNYTSANNAWANFGVAADADNSMTWYNAGGSAKASMSGNGQLRLQTLGSAANDITQYALRIQPNGALAANWRPFGVALTSGATTADVYIDGTGALTLNPNSSAMTGVFIRQLGQVPWGLQIQNTTYQSGATGASGFNIFQSNTGQTGIFNAGQPTCYFGLNSNMRVGLQGSASATVAFQVDQSVSANICVLANHTNAASGVTPTSLSCQVLTSGTPVAGFGSRQDVQLHSSTNVLRTASMCVTSWVTATDASRAARLSISVFDATSSREGLRIDTNGTTAYTTIPGPTPATGNFGLINLGSGPFDGATAGFFVGTSNGTALAINTATGFSGNLLDLQVAGVTQLRLSSVGILTPGTAVAFGTSPATIGNIRFQQTGSVWYRNNAGNSDVRLFACGQYQGSSLADGLTIGGGTTTKLSIAAGSVINLEAQVLFDWQGSASNNLTKYTQLIQPGGALAANYSAIGVCAASGDTVVSFEVDKAGKMQWGPGGSSALDVNLYRGGVNILKTDFGLTVLGSPVFGAIGTIVDTTAFGRVITRNTTATLTAFRSTIDGDANHMWNVRVDGRMDWGPGGAVAVDTSLYRGAANRLDTDGSLRFAVAGGGLLIKEGANATMGVATLVGGTVVVNTTKVTASSRIYLTGQNASGAAGALGVSARVAGTSFTITSLSGTDTRDVAWMIVEPA